MASCVLDSTNKQMYRHDILEITSNYASSTSNYYSDSDCKIALYSENLSGYYQLKSDSLYGTTTLVVNLSTISILPELAIIATLFNQKNFCNVSNWASGQLQFFNDVSVCGITATSSSKIERNGSDELYLNSVKYLKN